MQLHLEVPGLVFQDINLGGANHISPSLGPFIKIRNFLSIPSLLRIFIQHGFGILSNALSVPLKGSSFIPCSVITGCACSVFLTSDSLQPHGLWPTGSFVHGVSQARCWSRQPFPTARDRPDPGSKPASLTPTRAAVFFTSALPGKPFC